MHTHGTVIRKLSGGERRRLYLLKLPMEELNVLLLDEPTNDLDTETLTVLEQFLEEFSGVVITVSHDRYFLDKVCDKLLIFQGQGQIVTHYGEYTEYLSRLKATEKNNIDKTEDEQVKVKQEEQAIASPKKKLTYMEQKEWEEIDKKIETAEQKLAEIRKEMVKSGSDFPKLQKLMEQEQKWNDELERLIERWTYLAEYADS